MTRATAVAGLLCLAMPALLSRAEDASLEGNRLIASAADQLARLPSLEAKLRQRVRLFGQELVGAGIYRQRTAGNLRMLRLEMRLQSDSGTTSLQQVSDGRTLWIRRDSDDQTSLGYVNLRTVQDAVAAHPERSPVPQVGATTIALGGLPQLLDGLERNFQFAAPEPAQLGDVPTWRLTGRWKPEALKALFADRSVPDEAHWPPQLPQSVTVVLGRDQQPPLFPYRITYARDERPAAGDEPVPAGPPATMQPMVVIELFEVRPRPDLDARHFTFQPNDQEVEDRTDEFLRGLGYPPAE